ncbi:putative transient receptor potential cation channel subfamily A member 1 [Penaeus vannamei]|uniref:Putative transient receptor potential cation channel subfamily A member 1 n=1 Tax=Penaeus vannamei TaxID=6689 RepID=A0A423S9N4_PENVA|nr:putative transient receptor potential cation channel subfamily A member 1 [Penaeus vannamei]
MQLTPLPLFSSTSPSCNRPIEVLQQPSKIHGLVCLAIIRNLPKVFEVVLTQAIVKSDIKENSKEFYIRYRFYPLQLNRDHLELERLQQNDPKWLPNPLMACNEMVKCGRVELLLHPLTQKFLEMKWEAYGRFIHMFNLALYVVFLGLVTFFGVGLLSTLDPEPFQPLADSSGPEAHRQEDGQSVFDDEENGATIVDADGGLNATEESLDDPRSSSASGGSWKDLKDDDATSEAPRRNPIVAWMFSKMENSEGQEPMNITMSTYITSLCIVLYAVIYISNLPNRSFPFLVLFHLLSSLSALNFSLTLTLASTSYLLIILIYPSSLSSPCFPASVFSPLSLPSLYSHLLLLSSPSFLPSLLLIPIFSPFPLHPSSLSLPPSLSFFLSPLLHSPALPLLPLTLSPPSHFPFLELPTHISHLPPLPCPPNIHPTLPPHPSPTLSTHLITYLSPAPHTILHLPSHKHPSLPPSLSHLLHPTTPPPLIPTTRHDPSSPPRQPPTPPDTPSEPLTTSPTLLHPIQRQHIPQTRPHSPHSPITATHNYVASGQLYPQPTHRHTAHQPRWIPQPVKPLRGALADDGSTGSSNAALACLDPRAWFAPSAFCILTQQGYPGASATKVVSPQAVIASDGSGRVGRGESKNELVKLIA